MNQAEKAFPRFHGRHKIREELRQKFKTVRKQFDKRLKKEKRQYENEFVVHLDEINTKNPRLFLGLIKETRSKEEILYTHECDKAWSDRDK